MTDLEVLKAMTGSSDESLLSALLQVAEEEILSQTRRTVLNDNLKPYVRKWALIAYNRLGTEGEVSRSGGGISASFAEIPADIKEAIRNNRLARVGGNAHEAESDKESESQETVSI